MEPVGAGLSRPCSSTIPLQTITSNPFNGTKRNKRQIGGQGRLKRKQRLFMCSGVRSGALRLKSFCFCMQGSKKLRKGGNDIDGVTRQQMGGNEISPAATLNAHFEFLLMQAAAVSSACALRQGQQGQYPGAAWWQAREWGRLRNMRSCQS